MYRYMCMQRTLTLSIALLLGAFLCMGFSQELKVKSFQISEGDLIARTSPRNDLNDKPCAVIRVGIGLREVKFAGNLMGDPIYEPGEYLVYMPQGNTELTVRHANFVPLTVRFSDYGIHRLESGCTYQLVILYPGTPAPPTETLVGNYLMMNITPSHARVSIDGQAAEATNSEGNFKLFLTPGSHTYRVEAEGYDEQSGRIQMANDRIDLAVRLRSVMATLRVHCATSGASIYIDDEYKGDGRWEGKLTPRTYLIEARKSGYRSLRQTVSLSKQQNLDLPLSELQPIYGSLRVDYEPENAEVYIDGKLLGRTPNVFRNLLVGTHTLKISKEGYIARTERVTISENQPSVVSGKLERLSNSGSISSSSSGGQTGFTKDKEEFEVNGVKLTMIRVEGGTFRMGATEEMENPRDVEKPVHEVTLSTYYLGETEVTQALWRAVMGRNPSYFKGDNHPVESVSWKDCQQFITKLNQLTGHTFSLPTEAQWEYAARGGNKSRHTQYSGSKNIGDVAWYSSNSGYETHPVGEKLPNELGLYDMSGNVWEWCSDCWGSYSSGSQRDPAGPNSGDGRVRRGGGWLSGPRNCRSSNRNGYEPSYRNFDLGLRLALRR